MSARTAVTSMIVGSVTPNISLTSDLRFRRQSRRHCARGRRRLVAGRGGRALMHMSMPCSALCSLHTSLASLKPRSRFVLPSCSAPRLLGSWSMPWLGLRYNVIGWLSISCVYCVALGGVALHLSAWCLLYMHPQVCQTARLGFTRELYSPYVQYSKALLRCRSWHLLDSLSSYTHFDCCTSMSSPANASTGFFERKGRELSSSLIPRCEQQHARHPSRSQLTVAQISFSPS